MPAHDLIFPRIARYQKASSELFIGNRIALAALLPSESIAIVHSNDVITSNADATHSFKQNSDLFYLTGVDQEDTALILFPNAKDPHDREILFVRETNEHLAVWEGAKLTKKEAREQTGVQRVMWMGEFHAMYQRLVLQAEQIFLACNEHPRGDLGYETKSMRFIKECQSRFPLHKYSRLSPLIYGLRAIKSEREFEMIQIACEITEAGFRRVLKFIKPGVGEWDVEAELIHEFIRRGSKGFAYSPIIASGKNACVLHYISNDQVLQPGDLLLLDVAAEFGGWNSDMTRCVPVSGKFSTRQRAVYDAVLRVMRFANGILKPGIFMEDYQKRILDFMNEELIQLGLYTAEEAAAAPKDKPLVKKYFMHGTSHHLGIDVHDVSRSGQAVEMGMIFTIEPGIYIPEEGIGVRLENVYMIGKDSNKDLMANIPIEADEIECLMASHELDA